MRRIVTKRIQKTSLKMTFFPAKGLRVLDNTKLGDSDAMVPRLRETVEKSTNPKEGKKLKKCLPFMKKSAWLCKR